jgi:anti-sigma factor RsiW
MFIVEHVHDDVLERYAMQRLSVEESEAVEDHLALCEHCLNRLDETTDYVGDIRRALSVTGPQSAMKPKLPSWLHRIFQPAMAIPAWAGIAIAAAAMIFMVARRESLGPAALAVLDGTRGVATEVHGTGPFNFELFVPEGAQAEAAKYHVEMVDDDGKKQWEGEVAGHNGKLHAIVQRKVAEGQYFLQVSDPASGARHEFAVRVEK